MLERFTGTEEYACLTLQSITSIPLEQRSEDVDKEVMRFLSRANVAMSDVAGKFSAEIYGEVGQELNDDARRLMCAMRGMEEIAPIIVWEGHPIRISLIKRQNTIFAEPGSIWVELFQGYSIATELFIHAWMKNGKNVIHDSHLRELNRVLATAEMFLTGRKFEQRFLIQQEGPFNLSQDLNHPGLFEFDNAKRIIRYRDKLTLKL